MFATQTFHTSEIELRVSFFSGTPRFSGVPFDVPSETPKSGLHSVGPPVERFE